MPSKPTGRLCGRPHRQEFVGDAPVLTFLQWKGVVVEAIHSKYYHAHMYEGPFQCPPSWVASYVGVSVRAVHKWRHCEAYADAVRRAANYHSPFHKVCKICDLGDYDIFIEALDLVAEKLAEAMGGSCKRPR